MSRNVLVTGAVRGIGRVIAFRLARDGLNVAISDININSTKLNDTQKEIEKLCRKFINLFGIFFCYKEAAKVMIAQEKGSKLIGACSVIGYKPWPYLQVIIARTQAAAVELTKHNITVNSYCCGMFYILF